MNVRIDGTSLRFKITDTELTKLLRGEDVAQDISIGGASMSLRIVAKAVVPDGLSSRLLTEKEATVLRLLVSPEKLALLKEMGRSRDGISVTSGNVDLHLLVDVRKPRLG